MRLRACAPPPLSPWRGGASASGSRSARLQRRCAAVLAGAQALRHRADPSRPVSVPHGRVETQQLDTCLFPVVALLALWSNAPAATPTDIVGPAGSARFGASVTVLANGNFVGTDPSCDAAGGLADAGPAHLYDGASLALLNTMTGNAAFDYVGGSVTVLAVAGCTGIISTSSSLIGSTASDQVGQLKTVELANFHYLVGSPHWDNAGIVDAGAVTFCSGATGCAGTITPANSLVGSSASDEVSGLGGGGISALSNGNYVVSPAWDNARTMDAGAVRYGLGDGGRS